jgi:hypothetical protein
MSFRSLLQAAKYGRPLTSKIQTAAPAERPSKPFSSLRLERGLDLESPGFEQRLRDVFRVLIATGPLAQARRAQVLVGRQLVFAHNLLKFGNGRGNRPDRLRLTPVRISSSLGHEKVPFCLRGMNFLTAFQLCMYMILRLVFGIHSHWYGAADKSTPHERILS